MIGCVSDTKIFANTDVGRRRKIIKGDSYFFAKKLVASVSPELLKLSNINRFLSD
jgi:hypothetical protein